MLTAESLAKAISTLPRTESGDVVKQVMQFLKTKGAMALLPRVIGSLSRLAEKNSAGEMFVVANAEGAAEALTAATSVGIDTATVKVVTDETLIGGYIVSKKGTQIDASYKTALLSVYRSAVRS
jgi:F0F1-type ATP synthase delta subunit